MITTFSRVAVVLPVEEPPRSNGMPMGAEVVGADIAIMPCRRRLAGRCGVARDAVGSLLFELEKGSVLVSPAEVHARQRAQAAMRSPQNAPAFRAWNISPPASVSCAGQHVFRAKSRLTSCRRSKLPDQQAGPSRGA